MSGLLVLTALCCLGSKRRAWYDFLNHVGRNGVPGNHNPSFSRGPDITVVEDVGIYVHGEVWATEICDGEGPPVVDTALLMTQPYASRCGPNHANVQGLSFAITCDFPGLFAQQPTLSPCGNGNCGNCGPMMPIPNPAACGGILEFVTAPNQCGTTLCDIVLTDDGEDQCVEDTGASSCQCNGCCTGLQCDPMGCMTVATPFLCPAGCQPEDCTKSINHQFSITIICVNDPPSFDCLGSGATSGANAAFKGDTTVEIPDYIFNIRTCSSCGATMNNENFDQVSFTISNDNPSLFNVQPSIHWDPNDPFTADLRYDPKECEVGTAAVTVRMFDDGGTVNGGMNVAPVDCVFQIEIRDRNTAPTYDLGPCPIVLDEDTGIYSADAWAKRLSKGCMSGSGEENQQDLTFNIQLINPADQGLFDVQPNINSLTGALSFTARANANSFGRNIEMYIQLCDDGVLKTNPPAPAPLCTCDPITNCPRCEIVIRPINDAPSFTPGEDVLIFENLCNLPVPPVPLTFVVPNWARDLSVGTPSEGLISPNPMVFNPEGQTLFFVVTTDNDGLFAAGGGPVIDDTGSLSFTLAPNANGISNVRATLWDTGPNPGNEGPTAVFKITVLPVNNRPTFDLDSKGVAPNILQVNENSGPLEYDSWLSRVSRGPDNELLQQLSLRTFVSNPACFRIQPTHDFTATTAVRLSFEPVMSTPNGVNCDSDVTVFVKDDGLSLRCNMMPGGCDCGDEAEVTFTIRVLSVNNPPSFVKGPNIVIQEDQFPMGFTSVSWATSISAGPGEGPPTPQAVTFIISTDNDGMFRNGQTPTIDPTTGNLFFVAAPDACGTVLATVYAEDNGVPPLRSTVEMFTITINCCNDPPEFTIPANILGNTLVECTARSCTRQFQNFLTDIRPGPVTAVDELSQAASIRFFLSGYDSSLFEGPDGEPKIDRFGTLTVTPRVNANSAAPFTVTITARDDGVNQAGCTGMSTQTFEMQITPLNNAPTFISGGNVEVLEDSGDALFPNWARQISAGPPDESTQTPGLTFSVSVDDVSLFATLPQVSTTTGALTFTPAPNAFGVTEARVILNDGQALNSQTTVSILITIIPVNDQPSFDSPPTVTVLEDAPAYSSQFATAINLGATNEASQGLSFRLSSFQSSPTNLFSVPPAITSGGVLTFSVSPNLWGTSTFNVIAQDTGGVQNLGRDTSTVHAATITVVSVNDFPTYQGALDVRGILEDSGLQTVTRFVHAITPGGGADELSQVVSFALTATDPTLFSTQPVLSGTGDFRSLQFTPASNAFGLTTVTLIASDNGPGTGDGVGGGPPDVRSAPSRIFTLEILPVNDMPTATLGAPPVVPEDATDLQGTISSWITQITKGAVNEASQQLSWRIIPADPTLFSSQPVVIGVSGSTNADLRFVPTANRNGQTSIQVCATDDGGTLNGGVDSTCWTSSITITPVDDPPVVTLDTSRIRVVEDSGSTTFDNWLVNVVPGPPDELSQGITSVTIEQDASATVIWSNQLTQLPRVIRYPQGPITVQVLPNAFGTVELQVVATDTGNNQARVPFTIEISPVNDQPSFTSLSTNIRSGENGGRYSQLWATAISPGPANEASQVLQFNIVVGDPLLFAQQPAVDATSGVLSFIPSATRSGNTTAVVTLQDNGGISNNGVDTSTSQTINIQVTGIQSLPTWTRGTDVTVLEDSGAYSGIFATTFRNVVGTPVFEIVSTVPDNITVNRPVIDSAGVLSFVPNLNTFGVVLVTAALTDPQQNLRSVDQSFSITILPVNDPPIFTVGPDITVFEDAPQQVVSQWLSFQNAGPLETDQTISYTATAAQPNLFSEQVRLSSISGDLTYTPNSNRNGNAAITVIARDTGGTANGGLDTSTPRTFTISIVAVNDAPQFSVGSNVQVNEDAPAADLVLAQWATGILPGPVDSTDEIGQTMQFQVQAGTAGLFASNPIISSTGTLSFTLAPNAFGVSQMSVTLIDNGGVANGGIDTSPPQTFTIEVLSVNDPPSFVPGALTIPIAAQTTYSQAWATSIIGGPPNENQRVRFEVSTDNPGIFSTQPQVSEAGVLSFTTSGTSAGGTARVSVVAFDSENLPSQPTTFEVVNEIVTTAVRALIRTTTSDVNFDRNAYAATVCASLNVQSDRCIVTAVRSDPQGLEVQVEFQPLPANRNEPTAVELARRFLASATTQNGMGIIRAWPTTPIGTGSVCVGLTTEVQCTATTGCVWSATSQSCNLVSTQGTTSGGGGSGLSPEQIALIVGICAAVILLLAAVAYYVLQKRKKDQQMQKLDSNATPNNSAEAAAKENNPLHDEFYGARSG